ncbi:hypothetical protein AB0A71_17185 [Kitasatospora aureofaciens]|uniref:hypothetical protein n=1 Tax=Kitasatospora aureofaciens TaxID=1894 RepID=UPI0033D836CF
MRVGVARPGVAVELLGPALESAPAAALPALVGHELRGLRGRLAPYEPQAARRLAELAGA